MEIFTALQGDKYPLHYKKWKLNLKNLAIICLVLLYISTFNETIIFNCNPVF